MLTIHPDLQSLIPALTDDEAQQLEANLLADGCRDPLVVWQEEQTLLDGHHRLEICERHGLTYDVCEVSLPDLDAAKLWMIAHQLGRRNLTPEQMSYLRGKLYEFRKGSRGGDRKSKGKTYPLIPLEDTASTLAAEHNVSAKTIKNDAAFARAVDDIAAAVGGEEGQGVRQAILARATKVTHDDVKALAEVATQDAALARDALAAVQEAPTPRQAQQMVRAAIQKVQPVPLVLELEPETPTPDEGKGAALPYTGDYEWYTPPAVLERVREVLGGIDLDPASCAVAQQTVQARRYYTITDNGLHHPWHGTVFLNPPYRLPEITGFLGKLVEELEAERTTEAIVLVNAATDTDWFQTISGWAEAICFPDGRLPFTHATRDVSHGPCVGQALLYFGPEVERFSDVFGALGLIMVLVNCKAPAPSLPFPQVTARQRPRGPLVGFGADRGEVARRIVDRMGVEYARDLAQEMAHQLGAAPPPLVSPDDPAAAAAPRARPAVTPGTVEATLLEAFHAAAPTGLRPKEAAATVGKPGGNVSGPLQSLCYKGYLRKEAGVYVLAQP
jgi:hypothetical protein